MLPLSIGFTLDRPLLRHDHRSSIYSTAFTQNRHNRSSYFLFPDRITRDTNRPSSPRIDVSSSSFMHQDIILDDNALSQQVRGLMENITCSPDDPDDPDVWIWSFDDDDASRDATKKARQIFFFLSIYLIPRFFVDYAFLLPHKDDCYSCSPTPRPRCVGIVISFAIALRSPVK